MFFLHVACKAFFCRKGQNSKIVHSADLGLNSTLQAVLSINASECLVSPEWLKCEGLNLEGNKGRMKNYSKGKNLKVVLVEVQLDCEKSDYINKPRAQQEMICTCHLILQQIYIYISASKHILFLKCHMIPTSYANGEQSPCLSQKTRKLEETH